MAEAYKWEFKHFHGISACLSALYGAERFDEFVDLLRVDTIGRAGDRFMTRVLGRALGL